MSVQYGKTLRESVKDIVSSFEKASPSTPTLTYFDLYKGQTVPVRLKRDDFDCSAISDYEIRAIEFKKSSSDESLDIIFYIKLWFAPLLSNQKRVVINDLRPNYNVSGDRKFTMPSGLYALFNAETGAQSIKLVKPKPFKIPLADGEYKYQWRPFKYDSNVSLTLHSTATSTIDSWQLVLAGIKESFPDIDETANDIILYVLRQVSFGRTDENPFTLFNFQFSFSDEANSKQNQWSSGEEDEEEQSKANLMPEEEE